jgi:capsular polysaccharide export protein
MVTPVNAAYASNIARLDSPATVAGAEAPRTPRHFLFVLGPFGPFSARLAAALRAGGARATRVILNTGDLCDWGLQHIAPYFGHRDGFAAWLADHIAAEGVTDVVLYGDCNPYCVDAHAVATAQGLAIHVLEQGYFRPDWITLERDGVNANSSLPRDPAFYREAATFARAVNAAPVGRITPSAVRNIFWYHTRSILGRPFFPRFKPPYSYSPLTQAGGHIRRYTAQRLAARRAARHLDAVLSMRGPLFLALLQRPGDSQLLRHSDMPTAEALIDHLVNSFARHAPPEARLVFKAHPLDQGLEPHERTLASAARREGVVGRVFYVDGGRLSDILPLAAGVVSANSTGGLAAIEFGAPTAVLGKAIYDMPGMTHQSGLDRFWVAPEKPDPSLYLAFRKVVMARTQVNGAYSGRFGIAMAVPEVARRLLAG